VTEWFQEIIFSLLSLWALTARLLIWFAENQEMQQR